MADVMHLDIETYCDLELSDVGVYKYAEHSSFKILLYGWALNDDPVIVEAMPSLKFAGYLRDPAITKVAHNANFETVCLRIPNDELEHWQDTMLMAAELGYPRSLEQAAVVLKLAEGKLDTGKALINIFSKPSKREPKPGEWEQFIEYNKRDVEVEREIYKLLAPLTAQREDERRLWYIDQKINERGVMVDKDLAEKAIEFAEKAQASAYERLMDITGLDRPTDAAIRKKFDIHSLSSKELPEVRRNRPELAAILDIRGELSKTSVKKFNAMVNTAGRQDRARGLSAFMGAGRTGRWAGRLVQLQNLPRPKLDNKQIDLARKAVKDGDFETFRLLYGGEEMATLSSLVRSAFIPRDGCRFIIADFSAIEARVLAWLANERWRLDVFRSDGKIYERSAERMFNLEPGSVGKSSPYRQKGKIAELALGYGGAVGALINMGALDMGLQEKELPALVKLWRNANQGVTKFWAELDKTLYAVLTDGAYYSPLLHSNNIAVRRNPLQPSMMQVQLPNGRLLSYVDAVHDGREVQYQGLNQTTNQWETQQLYGAKLTENIVQATARDFLAEVLVDAEAAGFSPVFHVHDEIVCEVPANMANDALQSVLDMMATPPSWAQGCPIKGDGEACDYYRK
jgi:DNA polymerase